MAFYPVGHVATVAGSERAFAVPVDKEIVLLDVINTKHHVFVRRSAPVAIDGVDELLAIAGGTVEVDHCHNVAVGGEELGVPSIRPIVTPGSLRSTVDEVLQRIFLALVKVGRPDK